MTLRKIDFFLITGVIINIMLVLFFVFVYFFTTKAKPEELKSYPAPKVPAIENQEIESIINKLKKVGDLPIYIDPTELGKINPYD